MNRALLLDNDPKFIIAAQKLFPNDTEWLATMDISKAEELADLMQFDVIIVRKQNEKMLQQFVHNNVLKLVPNGQKPLKKLVVLPQFFWRHFLKRMCRKSQS